MLSGRLIIIALALSVVCLILLAAIFVLILRMSDLEREEFRRRKNFQDYSVEAGMVTLFWILVHIIPELIIAAGLLYLLGL